MSVLLITRKSKIARNISEMLVNHDVLKKSPKSTEFCLYCARGGERSKSLGWSTWKIIIY